jgi:hypothetical protein
MNDSCTSISGLSIWSISLEVGEVKEEIELAIGRELIGLLCTLGTM